jgi:hypothetical protein
MGQETQPARFAPPIFAGSSASLQERSGAARKPIGGGRLGAS